MSSSLQIEVTPTRAPFDEPVAIRVGGAEPGEMVTIRAEMVDHLARRWSSHAEFKADTRGQVDLVRNAPVSGTYDGVDPMGLFWSMRTAEPHTLLVPTGPLSWTLTADASAGRSATATVERLLIPDGVSVRDVQEHGVVGRMFVPSGAGPFPAVITLSGSAGGLPQLPAALLAGHGFATVALAYFNFGPLRGELVDIPLEYFESALDWLARQPSVRGDAIAVMGVSKGGELALLLGATFPQVRAVVGLVPSHVLHAGIEAGPGASPARRPSWNYRGSEFPFVPRGVVPRASERSGSDDEPIAVVSLYEAALFDEKAVERATIPVEKINGPVLLVSGRDDQMWPSALMADRVVERLERHRHMFPVRHLAYEDAGHLITPAYLPTTALAVRHPVRNLVLAFGGTPQANARAQADSWPRIVRFLEESLGPTSA
jgi:dienelactone hydrolase